MTLKCIHCKKEFKDKYLGGIRYYTIFKDNIVCGKCYNEGKDFPEVV